MNPADKYESKQRPYQGHCKEHGDFDGTAHSYIAAVDDEGNIEEGWFHSSCPDCVEERRQSEIDRKRVDWETRYGQTPQRAFPSNLLDASFSTFRTSEDKVDRAEQIEMLDKLEQYAELLIRTLPEHGRARSLFLSGAKDTGKSHLLVSIGRETMAAGILTQYLTVNDFPSLIGGGSWYSGADPLHPYLQARVLILDDLDRALTFSDRQKAILEGFVKDRQLHDRVTLGAMRLGFDVVEKEVSAPGRPTPLSQLMRPGFCYRVPITWRPVPLPDAIPDPIGLGA